MAKLNVIIPSADVEVIGADGERTKYRKVERKAKAGDIVKALKSSIDIDKGAFYGPLYVKYGLGFDDNVGDSRGGQISNYASDYEVYEKVSETTSKYREVKRHAKVGERIKIVDARGNFDYEDGDEFTVTSVIGTNGGVMFIDRAGEENWAAASEYVVLEPVERLKVGEYAKKVSDAGAESVGTILKITKNDRISDFGFIYATEDLNGQRGDIYALDQLIRATDEEVAAAKEEARWASIGRKVNEFKRGDLVGIIANTNSSVNGVGDIGEVTYIGSKNIRVDAGKGDRNNWSIPSEVKLIVPVEQRFDLPKGGASSSK
ncbi:hypothetical protein PASE110613_09365 [Paenibacillus sediminis]|uniref:Uncharacterized protein n=1 Tax=Paenibacillus sediminis TaxID=664909 RepID=A0ABS4H6H6_9BACL|nr:hypothetical protein [Paenibacillus sediminis]MBP1938143.1 hypothetical protein [Paenibacillus sediminis]